MNSETWAQLDPALLSELHALLSNHLEAGNFLRGPEPAAVGDRAFQPGETISARFEIRRLLGLGGMGEVYEAVDLKGWASYLASSLALRLDASGHVNLSSTWKHGIVPPSYIRANTFLSGVEFKY